MVINETIASYTFKSNFLKYIFVCISMFSLSRINHFLFGFVILLQQFHASFLDDCSVHGLSIQDPQSLLLSIQPLICMTEPYSFSSFRNVSYLKPYFLFETNCSSVSPRMPHRMTLENTLPFEFNVSDVPWSSAKEALTSLLQLDLFFSLLELQSFESSLTS